MLAIKKILKGGIALFIASIIGREAAAKIAEPKPIDLRIVDANQEIVENYPSSTLFSLDLSKVNNNISIQEPQKNSLESILDNNSFGWEGSKESKLTITQENLRYKPTDSLTLELGDGYVHVQYIRDFNEENHLYVSLTQKSVRSNMLKLLLFNSSKGTQFALGATKHVTEPMNYFTGAKKTFTLRNNLKISGDVLVGISKFGLELDSYKVEAIYNTDRLDFGVDYEFFSKKRYRFLEKAFSGKISWRAIESSNFNCDVSYRYREDDEITHILSIDPLIRIAEYNWLRPIVEFRSPSGDWRFGFQLSIFSKPSKREPVSVYGDWITHNTPFNYENRAKYFNSARRISELGSALGYVYWDNRSVERVLNEHRGNCLEQANAIAMLLEEISHEAYVLMYWAPPNELGHAVSLDLTDSVAYEYGRSYVIKNGGSLEDIAIATINQAARFLALRPGEYEIYFRFARPHSSPTDTFNNYLIEGSFNYQQKDLPHTTEKGILTYGSVFK